MTATPYRVLWLTTSASWDGPGRALAAVLQHWPDDTTMAVLALKGVDEPFRQALGARVRIEALGMRHLADVRVVGAIRAFIEEWRPELVHTQLSRADWIGRLVARWCRVPVVSTIQNVHSRMYAAEFPWLTSRAALLLDRLTARLAARVIAVSEGVKHDLLASGLPPDQVVVIPNPFDLSRTASTLDRAAARARLGATDRDVVCGTVALLKEQKGLADLVAAARIVCRENPAVRFVHVGGGPLEASVRRWISEAGLANRFTLMGWVPDPLELLPGMDLFALPSLWEGLPVALLEAMAAERATVGTRVAGIEEVIVDEVTGRLVPARQPAALAQAILDLARDPDRRQAMGAAGRARLALYDARRIAIATRDLHLSVIGRQLPGQA